MSEEVASKGRVKKTRTTNVVRNAGCAHSRNTLKFFFNHLMNELINRVYLERLICH